MQSDTFAERVRTVVRTIPKGETRSYKEVAAVAGSPNAARAVGTIMSRNVDTTVPCRRVVRSVGKKMIWRPA
ncbi:MGMT family protein [Patescibacteria group bacterium]|nr:MGMT family protein [Patescibacteria group bacterium]